MDYLYLLATVLFVQGIKGMTSMKTCRRGNRVSEVIDRMRALFKKAPLREEDVDINGAILEVNPTSLSQIQNGSSKSFEVSNVGNSLVCVTFASDKPDFNPDDFGQILPGFPISEKVSFSSSTGDESGTITIKHASCFPPIKSAAFCTPPPTVPVTGHN